MCVLQTHATLGSFGIYPSIYLSCLLFITNTTLQKAVSLACTKPVYAASVQRRSVTQHHPSAFCSRWYAYKYPSWPAGGRWRGRSLSLAFLLPAKELPKNSHVHKVMRTSNRSLKRGTSLPEYQTIKNLQKQSGSKDIIPPPPQKKGSRTSALLQPPFIHQQSSWLGMENNS